MRFMPPDPPCDLDVRPMIDFASDTFIQNPYPSYQALLEQGGIYEHPDTGFYYVGRYDLVRELFKHPTASSDRFSSAYRALPEPMQQYTRPLFDSISKWILFLDPPLHPKVRKVINPAFSAQLIQSILPDIHRMARQLITECGNRFDVVPALAYPLPVMMISQLLGVPDSDAALVRKWSDAIARFLGEHQTAQQLLDIQNCIIEASAYFADLIAEQRQRPTSFLLSQLLAFQKNEPEFSDEHLIANTIALIFAGHETTTNAITNGLFNLINHAERLDHHQPSDLRMDTLVDECLRIESPVQRIARQLKGSVELPTQTLESGRRVILLLGAANRDSDQFEQPDIFKPDRANAGSHLAFGHGPHFCTGSQLARAEVNAVISEVLTHFRLQDLALEEYKWRNNIGLRGFEYLNLRIQ